MRLVLDTNVIVTAMRSPTGASAALLVAAAAGESDLLANVALAVEYEAICLRADHVMASGLTTQEVASFLDAVIALVEPVESHFLWRPQLHDPADELVLEAAANGRADAIVTFNQRDFGSAPRAFRHRGTAPATTLQRI